MAENNTMTAETRTKFGKGAARSLRREGKTPAVVYGHGSDPRHVALPSHELSLVLRRSNAVIELDIDGTDNQLVLVKDVQKDPVLQIVEHVDLVILRRGEKVEVEVPLHIEGEPVTGTVANLDLTHLLVSVLAIAIPEHIVVSVEGLDEGARIHAKDVVLPEGAELLTDPDEAVVSIEIPSEIPEPVETEAVEGEEGAEAADADSADASDE